MTKRFRSFILFSLVLCSCTPAPSKSRGGDMDDTGDGVGVDAAGVPAPGLRAADASQIARDTSAAMPPATDPVEPAAGVARAEDAGRSAASSDAKDGAAGAPPPAGSADCGKLHYCEDFERYPVGTIPGSPWGKSMSTGTVMAVDTTNANTGTKSLHIKLPPNPSYTAAFLKQTAGATIPIPGNNLFGRYMVFYQPPPSNKVHYVNIDFLGRNNAGGVDLNLGGGINFRFPGSETGRGFGAGWPAPAKWHCVQFQADSSGSPPKNQVRVWVDGAKVVDVAGWALAPSWTGLHFGYEDYGGRPAAAEMWLDDLALSDSMVACPQAP